MKAVSETMFLAAIAFSLFFAGQSAHAQPSEKGLKDIYANYFRIGTCYPYQQTSNTQLQNVILREFNSLTHENDLKPEATMVQNGSTDDDIKVQLNDNARAVMKFAQDNNIPIRGHTLVWHQQTPNWFFYSNMQSGGGNLASAAVMSKRMESYIKNIFKLIKTDFPTLNLYAYDVVNEIFQNDGKQRNEGDPNTGGDESTWIKIYKNSSFVDSAFKYAKAARDQYFPNCKLFYNDFNEYHPEGKADSIVALYNRLKDKGMDGIGMQSHLSTDWPPVSTYKTALSKFVATGAEIHVTELDIEIKGSANEAKQAELYENVFTALKEAREEGANITSVSVWGVKDEWSWRSGDKPLLFKEDYVKKPAYESVAALIPAKDHGDGKNPQFNTPKPGEVTTDENGYFFHHTFENGATHSWSRRGDNVAIENSTAQKNSGSASLFVRGRNDTWNGAMFSLPDREFKAGDERSFSVMVRHEASGAKTVSLSLQYNNSSGTESYANIGSVEAVASNTWVQISNTAYELPTGSSFAIYVELDDANANFYVDDAMGGEKGATINPDGTPGEPPARPSSSSAGASSSSSEDDGSPIRLTNSFSKVNFRVSSLNGSLQIESRANTEVYLYNINGNKVLNFNVPAGESIVKMSLPSGIYIVKNARTKETQKVLVK